jgi:predicted nuclease of predicted toxin-antitoxin system
LRLLIDENLSPPLASWACELGIPAEAAVHVGLAGAKDDAVFAHALARDQMVVTVNVGDFIRLAATMEVHPGVIALREAGLSAEQQWLRVQSALQLIQHGKDTDMINRVVEIQSEAVHVWHEIPAS